MNDIPPEVGPRPIRHAPSSGRELLWLAVTSGLLADAQARALLARHPQADDPTEVTELLVRDGALPRLVAALLLLGYPEGLTIPRYRLVELLGRGGMASVFRAEDTTLRRPVAVKVMQPLGRGERERFAREVLAAAAVTHPNVVRTYDGSEHADVPYLVMELLTGRTLHALRHAVSPSIADVVDYLTQAARGVAAVHAAGLVHRDVKPGNLMLCSDGTVKLLDLGLARFTRSAVPDSKRHAPLTRRMPAATFIGTLGYIAPEQMHDSAAADHRADIFGLGATLFHLVAGRPPRPGLAPDEPLPPPPDLAAVRPDTPPELARLVARMMATDPDDRPQTARAVIDELAAVPVGPDTLPLRRERTQRLAHAACERVAPKPPAPLVRLTRRQFVAAVGVLAVAPLVPVLWPKSRPAAVMPPPAAPRFAAEDGGTLVRFDKPVQCVATSPDGRFTATTLSGGRTALYDAVNGATTWLPGNGSHAWGLGFAADGAKLAYASGPRSVGVWSLATSATEVSWECEDAVVSLALRPDGRFVAAGMSNGRIGVRSLQTGVESHAQYTSPTAVVAVAFRPGADELYFATQIVPSVNRLNWEAGMMAAASVGPGMVLGGQLVPLADTGVAILTTERLSLHAADTMQFGRLIPPADRGPKLNSAAAGPSARWVATGGQDGWVRLWDTDTGEELAAAPVAAAPIRSLALSPTGKSAVAGSADGTVHRVRLTTPE